MALGRKLQDLTGQKFNRLTAQTFLGRQHHSSMWRCACDCGVTVEVQAGDLKSGRTQSCGCFRKERMGGLTLKHGERGGEKRARTTPEYKAWEQMRDRCRNPRNSAYEWYGGRGIRVCPEWAEDFARFLSDVGRKPSADHSLDRFPDQNGHYEPGNVRWATDLEQARNRRNNSPVTIDGRRVARSEAAEISGLAPATLTKRLNSGWPLEEALSRPLNTRKSSKHRA